jgi:hypothetical protein
VGRALVCLTLMLATACGGDSDPGGSGAIGSEGAAEAAYQEAYTAAWVKSCKAAVADIGENATRRAAQVDCGRPVEQMEGNTSFDPEQATIEGRRQGTFDGCAYAWDEAYGASGEVEPRC